MQTDPGQPRFQAGGTLSEGAIYIERPADRELPAALLSGELCYVLAPRQIGKSSLRARTAGKLEALGYRCATIDVTALGTHDTTAAEWYFDLIAKLAIQFALPYPDAFWRQHELTSPVHRWSIFLRDQVLSQIAQPIAIFIDEIDATLALRASLRDDFFASLRAIHNLRASEPAWRRLSLCLFGVAMPGDLIDDPARTPFNIGRGLLIEDVPRREMAPFGVGLATLGTDPTALLDAIFSWTEGHPYMVQKICQALCDHGATGPADVDTVVAELFLRRGRVLEANLWYAEKCFSRAADPRTAHMLRLYGRLRAGERVMAQGQDPVQMALRLTGIAAERREEDDIVLRVRNRIFASIFDLRWVREQEANRTFAAPLERWLLSARKDDYVLRGEALAEASGWAQARSDLAPDESAFLMASLEAARREEREQHDRQRDRERREQAEAQARIQRRNSVSLAALVVLLLAALGGTGMEYFSAVEARRAEQGRLASLLAHQPDHAAEALVAAVQAASPAVLRHQRLPPSILQGLSDAAATSLRPARVLKGMSAVDFSPDGERLATSDWTGGVWLWNASTATLRVRLPGHQLCVRSVRFSPDGSNLVSAGDDTTARIWDGRSGQLLHVLSGHWAAVRSAEFSPDGTRVVTASDDGTAQIWDAASGTARVSLKGHQGWVWQARFSPTGDRVVTASDDETARIWDASNGRSLVVLKAHEGWVRDAEFSPDGLQVVTASADSTARTWDSADGRLRSTLRGHTGSVHSARFSPDGRCVITASEDGTVRIWSATAGKPLQILAGHTRPVRHAEFSPDGAQALTASDDQTARTWDVRSGRSLFLLKGHAGPVMAARFSPDGRQVATSSRDETARLWDVTRRADQPLMLSGRDASLSPDGRLLATAGDDGVARIWDVRSGAPQQVLKGRAAAVSIVRFSPDGRLVATADEDRVVSLWDGTSGQERGALDRLPALATTVEFSPDGRQVLVVARTDGTDTGRLWEVGTAAAPRILAGHQGVIVSALFSPDGRRIATASADGTARLWDATTGRPLQVLAGHSTWLTDVAFSPDSRLVATTSDDKTARAWEVGSARPLGVFRGHSARVRTVRFGPDGTSVVSTADEGPARVWHAITGKERFALGDPALFAEFSPDGQQIITAGRDQTTRIWDARTGLLLLTLGAAGPPATRPLGTASSQAPSPPRVRGAPTYGDFTARFLPDGRHALTLTGDHTIYLSPIAPEELLALACGSLRGQPEFTQVQSSCAPYPPR